MRLPETDPPRSGTLALIEDAALCRSHRAVGSAFTRRATDAAVLLGASGLAWGLLDGASAVFAAAWAVAVVTVIRSDLDRFIIPDAASAGIAALGLAHRLLAAWPQGGQVAADDVVGAVSGALLAFGVIWAIAILFRRRAGLDGLGFGDVKLAGASAVWLGAMQQVMALEIACLAALAAVFIAARGRDLRGRAVPFGAFLAPSAWLVFVCGPGAAGLIERWT